MNDIKKLSDAIDEKRAQANRLTADIERCNSTINADDRHSATLAELQKRRDELVADGFISGKAADTSDLDNEIREIEKTCASSNAQRLVASTAIRLLEQRLADANDGIGQLVHERAEMVSLYLREAFGSAEAKYGEAAELMRCALAEMSAAAGLLSFPQFGQCKSFGAIVGSYLDGLANRGLVVRSATGNIGLPVWLLAHDPADRQAKRAELIATLKADGVEL